MKHANRLCWAVGLFVAVGLLGCNSASNDKPTANGDSQKMAGTWTLAAGEQDGEPLAEEVIKNGKLTIVGDAYTVELGEMGVKKGTQKVDATKTPKQIDAQDAAGPTVGLNHGIYEFTADGDFRVCFAATGKDRPTQFATKPGSGHFMHLWRRAKAE